MVDSRPTIVTPRWTARPARSRTQYLVHPLRPGWMGVRWTPTGRALRYYLVTLTASGFYCPTTGHFHPTLTAVARALTHRGRCRNAH